MSLIPALRSSLACTGLLMRVPRWGTERMMAGNRKNHIKFLSRMLGRAQDPPLQRNQQHHMGAGVGETYEAT
jgi:hypothetical protein